MDMFSAGLPFPSFSSWTFLQQIYPSPLSNMDVAAGGSITPFTLPTMYWRWRCTQPTPRLNGLTTKNDTLAAAIELR
jgi:hypothetical protein